MSRVDTEHRLTTLLELISENVDVASLIEHVAFGETELIEAALQQSKLHLEASRLRVQTMHRRTALEGQLALEISQLSQRYRRIRNPEGKKEHTEGAVKAYVEMQPSIVKLHKKVNLAIAKEEMAKHLVDVYRSRRDVIRIIIDAGKISLQARELALLKGSSKLRSAVRSLQQRHSLQNEL